MRIEDIRSKVLETLKKEFPTTSTLYPATDDQIEKAHFMRAKDAKAIRECCARHQLQVSFRAAGADTITRIKDGNPCKGHTIMDKSIKQAGDGSWTYVAAADKLNKLRGFIGHKDDLPPEDANYNRLTGVWMLEHPQKEVCVAPERVTGTEKTAFTGDYDMHDLLFKWNRIVAGTPDEHSYVETLNNALLAGDADRKAHVVATLGGTERNFHSPYALIRHGAQTSYMSFLLSNEKELAKCLEIVKEQEAQGKICLVAEQSVVNISDSIVMFESDGNAYILSGLKEVYSYYASRGLLQQIPFYYFFKFLKGTPVSGEIIGFINDINRLLVWSVDHR